MELTEKQRLLRIRVQMKAKRPRFPRFDSWRFGRLAHHKGWRKQRGIDSKTREKTKGGVKSPEPGYRGPTDVRGLHPSGLEDVLIIKKSDLDLLDPTKHAVRIAARLGAKKKVNLIEYTREKGFRVLNVGVSKKELAEIDQLAKEEESAEDASKSDAKKEKKTGDSEKKPRKKRTSKPSKEQDKEKDQKEVIEESTEKQVAADSTKIVQDSPKKTTRKRTKAKPTDQEN